MTTGPRTAAGDQRRKNVIGITGAGSQQRSAMNNYGMKSRIRTSRSSRGDFTSRCRHGFTLIELLVVVSIIALLVSILLPALSRARDQAKQTVCLVHMRQFGMALLMYADNNNDFVVRGRFHNKGDWISVNSWYSNLTPYLDPQKRVDPYVWAMSQDEAELYNEIWDQMICPAARVDPAANDIYQGVRMRTYGMNIGVGYVPGTSYDDGYGLLDWGTGRTRKLSKITRPSEMMCFCDTRNMDYAYAEYYAWCEANYSADYFFGIMPKRHPGGYAGTFIDGHGAMIPLVRMQDYHDSIWHM